MTLSLTLAGGAIARMVDGGLGPGEHWFSFTAPASGVYVARLTLDRKDSHNTKLVVPG